MVERNNTVAPDNLSQNHNKKHPYFCQKIGKNDPFFDKFCPIFQQLFNFNNSRIYKLLWGCNQIIWGSYPHPPEVCYY